MPESVVAELLSAMQEENPDSGLLPSGMISFEHSRHMPVDDLSTSRNLHGLYTESVNASYSYHGIAGNTDSPPSFLLVVYSEQDAHAPAELSGSVRSVLLTCPDNAATILRGRSCRNIGKQGGLEVDVLISCGLKCAAPSLSIDRDVIEATVITRDGFVRTFQRVPGTLSGDPSDDEELPVWAQVLTVRQTGGGARARLPPWYLMQAATLSGRSVRFDNQLPLVASLHPDKHVVISRAYSLDGSRFDGVVATTVTYKSFINKLGIERIRHCTAPNACALVDQYLNIIFLSRKTTLPANLRTATPCAFRFAFVLKNVSFLPFRMHAFSAFAGCYKQRQLLCR